MKMNRRAFMRTLVFGAAVAAAPAVVSIAAVESGPLKSNLRISVELLSDSRFNIDKFIREAVRREVMETERKFWENWEHDIIFGNPSLPGPSGIFDASKA